MSKLSMRKTWLGTHKGINFEINNFKLSAGLEQTKECWTYYLYISLARCPKDVAARLWLKPHRNVLGRSSYSYDDEALIADIEWHSGCTFYEKYAGFDEEPRMIKIGCDYMHHWDEQEVYTEEGIAKDAEIAIDSFLAMVPGYLVRCGYYGKAFHKEFMRYWGDGYILMQKM